MVGEKDSTKGFILCALLVVQQGLSAEEANQIKIEVKHMVDQVIGQQVCLERLLLMSSLPKVSFDN